MTNHTTKRTNEAGEGAKPEPFGSAFTFKAEGLL